MSKVLEGDYMNYTINQRLNEMIQDHEQPVQNLFQVPQREPMKLRPVSGRRVCLIDL